MSAAGRKTWTKSFPGDESVASSGAAAVQTEAPVAIGVRPKGILSFFKTLPRACIGFLLAVFFDVGVMVSYGSVLLMTGLGASSSYFAVCTIASGVTLVYFAISSIRSENTVELLAAIVMATCVNATVIYFRSNENAFAAVQRRGSNVFSSTSSKIMPPEVLNAAILSWTALVQLAVLGFGYASYRDFGWRIFKLFGIDFNMRQVYERFLWFSAMLKLDLMMALLNVFAGFFFFFKAPPPSSYTISSHPISPHPISSHPIPSHPISSHPIPSHPISSPPSAAVAASVSRCTASHLAPPTI